MTELKRALVATALVVLNGCARSQAPLSADTHSIAVGGTGICFEIPTSLDGETKADDHGYVDVVVGHADRDRCVAGIEVYLAAAPDRPRDLEALRQSIERDHEPQYKLSVAPQIVQRDGRPTVTATLESTERGLRQRQWAFLLSSDPVVVSFYTTHALADCEPLETAILSSVRRGQCAAPRSP
jgi:hypothetical protein